MYFLVISLKTRTTPWMLFWSSFIGAPESAIWYSFPSFEINLVWFASPTIFPVLITASTGFSPFSPVSELTILNTLSSGRFKAFSSFHPVSSSATGFILVISPFLSVAITASPIELRVVFRSVKLLWSASSDSFRSIICPRLTADLSSRYLARSIINFGRGRYSCDAFLNFSTDIL